MARIARIVVPNLPHHIVQRGNRRMPVFFNNRDKEFYIKLLKECALKAGIEFWAYCLMDNHVHFIAVPEREESFRLGFGEAHRRYTRAINFREGWRGYLWQGRFFSYPLSEAHLYAAIKYVELNPVKAKLVKRTEDYLWSSAKAHVTRGEDKLCSQHFMTEEIQDWSAYLSAQEKAGEQINFSSHISTGRPLGDDNFITKLEQLTGRKLRKQKPGRKCGN